MTSALLTQIIVICVRIRVDDAGHCLGVDFRYKHSAI